MPFGRHWKEWDFRPWEEEAEENERDFYEDKIDSYER
jgi:hypothetical protein